MGSKSTKNVSKLTKALNKLNLAEGTTITVYEGDNSFACVLLFGQLHPSHQNQNFHN